MRSTGCASTSSRPASSIRRVHVSGCVPLRRCCGRCDLSSSTAVRPDLRGAVAAALRRARDGGDDVQLVLASGLLDPMWVEEQTGRSLATPEEAAAAYLADPGCSPHPLFVP